MSALLRAGAGLGLLLICAATAQVSAHGDPELEEQQVLIVAVGKDATSGDLSSQPFQLTVPSNTVELFWRIESSQKDRITFSVLSGSGVLARELKDESKSRILKADSLTIGNVSGTNEPFVIEIYAHTVHWLR